MALSEMKKTKIISVLIFIVLVVWWLALQIGSFGDDSKRELFSASYGVLAFWGGLVGLFEAKRWGGTKSLLGRAIIFLSIGLLFQFFGQLAYSAYTYIFLVEIPYPSVGDIGYFGSIFFYIAGAWYLSSTVGIKYALDKLGNRVVAFLIPIFSLVVCYIFFLQNIQIDTSQPMLTFLNLGYPFGQAVYVGVAITGFMLSRKLLGGTMRSRLSLLLLSLLMQYASDFVFLYQTNSGTWQVAGINELMYLISYFLMTLSIVSLDSAIDLTKVGKINVNNG